MHLPTFYFLMFSILPCILDARHDGKAHGRLHLKRQELPAPGVQRLEDLDADVAQNDPNNGIDSIDVENYEGDPSIVNDEYTSAASLPVPYITESVPLDFTRSSTPLIQTGVPSSDSAPRSPPGFSTTVIQVPVATVCPDTPSHAAVFPLLPLNFTASNATGSPTFAGPGFRINATALLPNGSSTIFLTAAPSSSAARASVSSASPAVSEPANESRGNPTARIILDSHGCQTVYSALTTQVCDATVTVPGGVDVHVSECGQWVVFRSEEGVGCDAGAWTSEPTSPATTSVLPVRAEDSTSSSLATSASPRPPSDDGTCVVPLPSPASPITTAPPIATATTFYLAHWHDLLHNPVPRTVRVETCLAQASCTTRSESWSLSVHSTESVRTWAVAFSGPAMIALDATSLLTTLAFSATLTTTVHLASSSIVRAPVPTTATHTWFLEEVAGMEEEAEEGSGTVTVAWQTTTRTISPAA